MPYVLERKCHTTHCHCLVSTVNENLKKVKCHLCQSFSYARLTGGVVKTNEINISVLENKRNFHKYCRNIQILIHELSLKCDGLCVMFSIYFFSNLVVKL